MFSGRFLSRSLGLVSDRTEKALVQMLKVLVSLPRVQPASHSSATWLLRIRSVLQSVT